MQFLSILQYTQLVDQYAHHRRRTSDFEVQNFFGQLKCILLVELLLAQELNVAAPTTVILALIQEVKATLRDGIYYYKEFGIVDLSTVQCIVGRIRDQTEWAIVDQSDSTVIQMD